MVIRYDQDRKSAAQESIVDPAKKDMLTTMRARFDEAVEAENGIRVLALEDLKFRAGDQWDEAIKAQRALDERPCLTINRLPQFVRQVTNDQRQNRPAIEVTPVDSGADVDTAKILQGMIRHIENDSNAEVAYDTAFQSAVNHGFGYFRVITQYTDQKSFTQCIKIKRIKNPFTVYMDPSCQEADYSDSNWGFVLEDHGIDEFKAKWPSAKLSSYADWSSVGDTTADWVNKDGCRVVEYYYKERTRKKLLKFSNGQVELEEKVPKNEYGSHLLPNGITVVTERMTSVDVIKWCKCTEVEVLEETVWLGEWIPIIPVLGDELDVNGKKILEGIIRHAKDPQRMYNYWATAEAEMIALAPKAPYIGAEGQFEGQEENWKAANTRNFAYLTYKPKALNGTPLPPPQRNVYEAPVAAITNARLQASDDLKSTTGIYDPSLGARSNERSGKAIVERKSQSQTSNFHYVDNLGRSLKHLGRILVDLIPKVYDEPRVMRIIGDDGTTSTVQINQEFDVNGVKKIYNLSAGKYDVVMQIGPAYATKRQQALDAMLQMTQANPELVNKAGDLIVENMDWAGARKLSARLRKFLPLGIAEDDKTGQQQVPPEIAQKLQESSQMIEALTQKVHETQDALDSEAGKIKAEQDTAAAQRASTENIENAKIQSEERIAFAKIKADLLAKLATVDSKDQQHGLTMEVEAMRAKIEALNTEDATAEGNSIAEALVTKLDELIKSVSGGSKKKVAIVTPQPDGSYKMESTEVASG